MTDKPSSGGELLWVWLWNLFVALCFLSGSFFVCVSSGHWLDWVWFVFSLSVCVWASDNTVCFEAFYFWTLWCDFMSTAYLIQTGLPDVSGISWHHREDVTSAGFLPDFHGNVCFPSWWRTQRVWMNLQASFSPFKFDCFCHHNSCVDDRFTLLL